MGRSLGFSWVTEAPGVAILRGKGNLGNRPCTSAANSWVADSTFHRATFTRWPMLPRGERVTALLGDGQSCEEVNRTAIVVLSGGNRAFTK